MEPQYIFLGLTLFLILIFVGWTRSMSSTTSTTNTVAGSPATATPPKDTAPKKSETYKESKMGWGSLVRVALVVFLLVAVVGSWFYWSTMVTWLPWGSNSSTALASARPITTPDCPGGEQLVTLTGEWTPINPGKKCRWVSDFPPGSIEYGEIENGDTFVALGWEQHKNASMARTKSGNPMTGHGALCPRDPLERPVDWDCSFL